jgi:hypothetical protein
MFTRVSLLALLAFGLLPSAQAGGTAAFSVTPLFLGNGYFVPQSAGDVFTTNANLTVSSLGVYDPLHSALLESHDVGIFDSVGDLIASATVPAGSVARLDGDFRYVDIAPVQLLQGQSYTIAALYLMLDGDLVGYSEPNLVQADPRITFGDYPARYTGQSNDQLNFPTLPGVSSSFYINANFEISTVPEPGSAALLLIGAGISGGLILITTWRSRRLPSSGPR